MGLLASPIAIGINEFLGHLDLELLGNSLHVGDGEHPLVAYTQAWFGHLASHQKVSDLVGLTPQNAGDLPQQKILCVFHTLSMQENPFFCDEKWWWPQKNAAIRSGGLHRPPRRPPGETRERGHTIQRKRP